MKIRASADSDRSMARGHVCWLKGIDSRGTKAILMYGTIASHNGESTLIISYLRNGIFRYYKE